ncbi:hypothetical protein BGZ76_001423 [Entomortierella beljakovae]|nr:hypothetical protein BGZ76_001423 [Entomortierella beljakovae]
MAAPTNNITTPSILAAVESDIANFSQERSFTLQNGNVIRARHWRSGHADAKTRDCRRFLAFHGFLDNASSFDLLLLKQLGPEPVEIVALDLAGHGLSSHRKTEDYALWRYVEDSDLIVSQLGWERHAILGHSMGGAVATVYGGLFESRVTLCILLDNLGPLIRDVEDQPDHLLEHFSQKRGLAKKRLPFHPSIESACKARSQGGAYGIQPEYASVLMSRGLKPAERALEDGSILKGWTWTTDRILTIRSAQSLSEGYAKAFMSRISCPLLAVLAEDGLLQITDAAGDQNDRQNWPKGKVTIKGVPGSHSVHMENAPLVAEKISSWVHEQDFSEAAKL